VQPWYLPAIGGRWRATASHWHSGQACRVQRPLPRQYRLPALGTVPVNIAAGRCCRRLGPLTTSVEPVPSSVGRENLRSLCIMYTHFMPNSCRFEVILCVFYADSMQVLCWSMHFLCNVYAYLCVYMQSLFTFYTYFIKVLCYIYAIYAKNYAYFIHVLCNFIRFLMQFRRVHKVHKYAIHALGTSIQC
jgi:hypothetical protein